MIDALRKVVKRLHYPVEVMLICARWYAAYPLSLRHIEEMGGNDGRTRGEAAVYRFEQDPIAISHSLDVQVGPGRDCEAIGATGEDIRLCRIAAVPRWGGLGLLLAIGLLWCARLRVGARTVVGSGSCKCRRLRPL